jgi:MFS family permease
MQREQGSFEPFDRGVRVPANGGALRWYSGATGGQWLALVAALLGWMFDGFEQGIFPILARPALVQLLGLANEEQIARGDQYSKEERDRARAAVDEPVRTWNAGMSAAYLLGAAAGGLAFGWIGDRIGRVRAMAFSVLTYALFTGSCGLAQAAWQLAALRFIAALGMGGEWALGVALVMEKWLPHARPVLAGLIGAAANVGFFLAGGVGKTVNTETYWRFVFLGCVLPALLTFLLRTFVPESERWEHAAASGPKARIRDIFGPGLRSRSLLGASIGAVALLATWGAVTWIPLWLGQAGGRDGKDLAAQGQLCAALGAVLGALLGAVLVGRLSRRMGYFVLCLLSLVVCQTLFVGFRSGPLGTGYFAIELVVREYKLDTRLPLGPDPLFFLVVFLVGGCSAAFYGWLPLYLPELFPTRVRATGQGFCYNFGRVLSAAGVLLTASINLGGNYPLASSLVCLIYLVGLVLAWFIPETKGQPLPE